MDNSLFNLNYILHLSHLYKRNKTIINCLADLFIGKDVYAARQYIIVWPNYQLRVIEATQDNWTLSYRSGQSKPARQSSIVLPNESCLLQDN